MKRKTSLSLFWIFFLAALVAAHVIGIPLRAWFLRATVLPYSFQEQEKEGIAVIGKRLDRFASVLILAAGDRDDVHVGDHVATHDGIYVGRVREVSPHASQVVLASHPGEHVSAWLPVLSVPIELEGWGAGLLRALVPEDFLLEEGDEVWEDARQEIFVGHVISIQEVQDTGALKKIFIQQAVNPLMLSYVYIRPALFTENPASPLDGSREP
ncbi:MAG: rod shape-determining protein MreC [Patescibacteria group bacterium]|jgi:cell shape-determining protein MreC